MRGELINKPEEETDERINGQERLIMITIVIMVNGSIVGHLIDVVNVVLVGRQRHSLAERICINRRVVALEVRPEITYAAAAAALVFEDGP